MSQTPPKSDKQAPGKQTKAARLQAALRDNLRRRKLADQGAINSAKVPLIENDPSQEPQN